MGLGFLLLLLLLLAGSIQKAEPLPKPALYQDTWTYNSSIHYEAWDPPDAWDKKSFPNPQKERIKCGRDGRTSLLCDPNNVVTIAEADGIDKLLHNIRTENSCPCPESAKCPEGAPGYVVSIAIIPKFDSRIHDDKKSNFVRYLQRVSWNYGTCDNDIVILLSESDNKIWMSRGEISQRRFSRECGELILKTHRNEISKKLYAKALRGMLKDMSKVLSGDIKDCFRAGAFQKPIQTTLVIVVTTVVGVSFLAICFIIQILRRVCGINLVPDCACPGSLE